MSLIWVRSVCLCLWQVASVRNFRIFIVIADNFGDKFSLRKYCILPNYMDR